MSTGQWAPRGRAGRRLCQPYRFWLLDTNTDYATETLGYLGETARAPMDRLLELYNVEYNGDNLDRIPQWEAEEQRAQRAAEGWCSRPGRALLGCTQHFETVCIRVNYGDQDGYRKTGERLCDYPGLCG